VISGVTSFRGTS